MPSCPKTARVIQVFIGLVFILAGMVKVWEPLLFYWEVLPLTQSLTQMLGLGNAIWPLPARLALLLGPIETGLGLALILNWRPGFVLPLSVSMTACFLGFMLYVWRLGAGDDCGCFGFLVERSPGEAATEDSVMLGLLLFAWWARKREEIGPRRINGWLVLGGTVLALALGGIRFFPVMDRLDASDLRVGFQISGLRLTGADADLMKGEHLVEFFSPICMKCERMVPMLNKGKEKPGLPQVIGLTAYAQDSAELLIFKLKTQPNYPMATISRPDFLRLTWRSPYPRLAYVRDGTILCVWESDDHPTWTQIESSITESVKR